MDDTINELLPSSEKKKKSYGLAFAKRFWAEFNRGGFFAVRREKYAQLERWAEGTQSTLDIQPLSGVTDPSMPSDTSYANLDMTPMPIVAAYVDEMVGSLMEQGYKLNCNAEDKNSTSQKFGTLEKELNKVRFAPILKEIEATTGLPTEQSKFETEEEAQLYHETNFKLPLEIAMEETCNLVWKNNDQSEIEKLIIRDLVVLKIAATKTYYHKDGRTMVRRINPANLITSQTKRADFQDSNTFGELVWLQVGEIKEYGEFSYEQLYMIASAFTGKYNNPSYINQYDYTQQDNSWLANLVPVFDFEFLNTDDESYSVRTNKYGTRKIKRGTNKNGETITKKVQNLYHGMWIIDSEFVFDYGISENMIVRRNGGEFSTTATSRFTIYAPNLRNNENKSHCERMIPYARQMNVAHIKIQQFMAMASPPGEDINVAGLASAIDIGKGRPSTFEELRVLKQQTGTQYYSSIDEAGNPNMRPPITPNMRPIGEVEKLVEIYNFNLAQIKNMVYGTSGLITNSPNPDIGLGARKIAMQGVANVMRPLRHAFTFLMEKTSELIVEMARDKAVYAPAIGDFSNNLLRLTKDLRLAEIGIILEWRPDDAEKAGMMATLDAAVKAGTIDPEDAFAISRIENVKLQEYYLRVRKAKNKKERMEEAQANIRLQSQTNAESGQAVEAAKTQGAIATSEAKIKEIWAQAAANVWEKQMLLPAELKTAETAHIHQLAELSLQSQLKPQNAQPTA